MFRDPQEMRRRLQEIIEKFRQKGATSPEKALTLEELDLPPRFEQAMHRRLGQTGIFVKVNGKYYLNEDRFKQIQQERANAGSGGDCWSRGRSSTWLRYVGILLMLPIGLIVVVLLFFFFNQAGVSYYPGEFLIVLLVVMVGMFVARMLFWRSRRRYCQNWRKPATNLKEKMLLLMLLQHNFLNLLLHLSKIKKHPKIGIRLCSAVQFL
jgi:hypothetical protein